jgi:phytol kinase
MKETYRQTIHLLMGVIGAWILLTLNAQLGLLFLSAVLLFVFLLFDLVACGYALPGLDRLIEETDRARELPFKGSLAFAVGALFCFIVFGGEYTAVGLITLGVLDSITTLAGLRFGRHTILHNKSVEGTITGVVAAAIVLLFFIPPGVALLVAGVGGPVELFSPIEDNLVIQVVVCTVLVLIS